MTELKFLLPMGCGLAKSAATRIRHGEQPLQKKATKEQYYIAQGFNLGSQWTG